MKIFDMKSHISYEITYEITYEMKYEMKLISWTHIWKYENMKWGITYFIYEIMSFDDLIYEIIKLIWWFDMKFDDVIFIGGVWKIHHHAATLKGGVFQLQWYIYNLLSEWEDGAEGWPTVPPQNPL